MTFLDETPLGSRRRGEVPIVGDENGASVVVHAVVGQRRHPCLAIVAGVHGDEYDGITASREVALDVEVGTLLGSFLIVPVANPFAFASAQRRTPDDNVDLNRVFPGRVGGSLSERLAHVLCRQVLVEADLVVTLHGAMATGILAPWIEFLNEPGPVGRAAYSAARASGFADLVGLPRLPGRLITAMAELGIPMIEGELGGCGALVPSNVRWYQDRVRAVAAHLGVMARTIDSLPRDGDTPVWALSDVSAPSAGVFVRHVELRQVVRAGQRLGDIVDAEGCVTSEIKALHDGVIGGYRVHAGVQVGDGLLTIWLHDSNHTA